MMKKDYSLNGKITLESMSSAFWYNKWVFDLFNKYLSNTILEVGCGNGNFTDKLAPFGNVYAIDIDRTLIAKTKQKIKKRAVVGFGDIEKGKFFFRNIKFDSIVCINVLEHIKNDDYALRNITKLLKRNGIFILLVPSHQSLYGKIDEAIGHFRRYEKKIIMNKIKRNKFKIIKMQHLNILGGLGWFVSGRLLKNSTVSTKKMKLFDRIAPFILPIEKKLNIPFGTSILLVAKKIK